MSTSDSYERQSFPNLNTVQSLIPTSVGVIEKSWGIKYQGDCQHLLFEALGDMIKKDRGGDDGIAYVNIATVLQSSGYGKSRMVLEHSRLVFTFPFNLRDPEETSNGVLIFSSLCRDIHFHIIRICLSFARQKPHYIHARTRTERTEHLKSIPSSTSCSFSLRGVHSCRTCATKRPGISGRHGTSSLVA